MTVMAGCALLVMALALSAQEAPPSSQEPSSSIPAPQEPNESVATSPVESGTDLAGRDDDTSESAPDGDAEGSEDDGPVVVATLVFTTDAPCIVAIDGARVGDLEPGAPLEIEVETLTLNVSGISAESIMARWAEDLTLELDETREIAIPMLETIEDLRKKERRELVYRDIHLGVMWTRRDNAADVSWARAKSYCEALNLGGFENWALPSLAELETLESKWSFRPAKIIDQLFLTSCCVWSTTPGVHDTMWNVDFRFRQEFESNPSLSYGLRALCRRDMTEPELADARLLADPKEQKRRMKEKRLRQDERERRKAEKAARAAADNSNGD